MNAEPEPLLRPIPALRTLAHRPIRPPVSAAGRLRGDRARRRGGGGARSGAGSQGRRRSRVLRRRRARARPDARPDAIWGHRRDGGSDLHALLFRVVDRRARDRRSAPRGVRPPAELPPAFFEVERTGDADLRLINDTSMLDTVIGSSASMAIRNLLLLAGGLVMLAVTSVKLTLLVLAGVPVVVVPIILFGRRVKKLARASQDHIGDVGATSTKRCTRSAPCRRTVRAGRRARFRLPRRGGVHDGGCPDTPTRDARCHGDHARVRRRRRDPVDRGHDVVAGRLSAGALWRSCSTR